MAYYRSKYRKFKKRVRRNWTSSRRRKIRRFKPKRTYAPSRGGIRL